MFSFEDIINEPIYIVDHSLLITETISLYLFFDFLNLLFFILIILFLWTFNRLCLFDNF